ncbi:MAG: hypothetical protein R6V05_06970 [Candidatus Brocadiia bacterium]
METELRIRPTRLGLHVLKSAPTGVTVGEAARALEEYLRAEHPELADAVRIWPADQRVTVRAEGPDAASVLRAVRELVAEGPSLEGVREIEVDPQEFAVDAGPLPRRVLDLEYLLRSEVRYFPHPVCEWYDVSTGHLTLTEECITYEPKWQIVTDDRTGRRGDHLITLEEIADCCRGVWWDIPCVMIETPGLTYRYGWPASVADPELAFDVDDWLVELRALLQRQR